MNYERAFSFIPNLLTLGNLLLGCLGIVFCFNENVEPLQASLTDPQGKNISVIFGYNSRLYLASFMIYAGAILDFFDGSVARWLNARSEIGKQLDSLADAVTFGVLPACIYYQLLAGAFQLQPTALQVPTLYFMPAFLIAATAVYRLAKFNVDVRQLHSFVGLATPANALFAASLPLMLFSNSLGLAPYILNKLVLYALILLFSWLMVSELPMFSLKMKPVRFRGNEWLFLFVAVCAALILLLTYAGIAAGIVLYILINAARYFIKKKNDVPPTHTDAVPQQTST